jgi:hypothetical protein
MVVVREDRRIDGAETAAQSAKAEGEHVLRYLSWMKEIGGWRVRLVLDL